MAQPSFHAAVNIASTHVRWTLHKGGDTVTFYRREATLLPFYRRDQHSETAARRWSLRDSEKIEEFLP